MKVRTSFVSNSSSSSFVVMPSKPSEYLDSIDELFGNYDYYDGISDNDNPFGFQEGGCYWFQWEVENYYDCKSKWNWCLIQATMYAINNNNDMTYLNQLRDWASEQVKEEIQLPSFGYLRKCVQGDDGGFWPSIDHQSCCYERPDNITVPFSDLTEFILGGAHIHTSNDNLEEGEDPEKDEFYGEKDGLYGY